jgi:hypothetical protein
MQGFDHLLGWTLQAGSHAFPGPDGGTCINEAALVAAGFAYREIRAAEEMPPCFSRPICRFAMLLNDHAGDEERQRLIPYVLRLACADSPAVERLRSAYIEQQTRGFQVRITFDRGARDPRGRALDRPAGGPARAAGGRGPAGRGGSGRRRGVRLTVPRTGTAAGSPSPRRTIPRCPGIDPGTDHAALVAGTSVQGPPDARRRARIAPASGGGHATATIG